MNNMPEKNIVDFGDLGQNVDDELAAIILLGGEAYEPGRTHFRALIGAGTASAKRANLGKSMLEAMGRPDIKVGVGYDPNPHDFRPYEFVTNYPKSTAVLSPARDVLGEVAEASPDGSMLYLIHSPMRDVAEFMESEPALARQKLGGAIIQAGVETDGLVPVLKNGKLKPDKSFNAASDEAAAEYVYDRLQRWGMPTTFVSKYAIMNGHTLSIADLICLAQMHPVGETLYQRAHGAARSQWDDINSPTAQTEQRHFPIDCSPQKFADTYLSGKLPEYHPDEEIHHYITDFQSHDSVAAFAAFDMNRERFFDPYTQNIDGTTHDIIGLRPGVTNLVDRKYANSKYMSGITGLWCLMSGFALEAMWNVSKGWNPVKDGIQVYE